MPEISRFFGIIIKMFFKDHSPPHFHVEFGEFRAIFNIQSQEIMEGSLPSKQLKLVQAWAVIHEEELIKNFNSLSSDSPTWNKIEPLR
ncbi:MAG: DUF4160 domain-containing protein [Bacteroidota bacterium]|jgi:hypothetical protein